MFAVGTLSLTNTSFLWDVQLLAAFALLLTTPFWSGFPPLPPACIAMPQCFSGRSLPNASSHLSCKQHTRWNCQDFLFLRIDLWWKHGRITHQGAWGSFMENSVWLHNGHIRVEGELGGQEQERGCLPLCGVKCGNPPVSLHWSSSQITKWCFHRHGTRVLVPSVIFQLRGLKKTGLKTQG